MSEQTKREAMTPATIGANKFRIPLYQRPYSWDEPQVQQLLDDLRTAYKENPGQDYHIGILSVAKAPDGVYDLIDGQQRMTTLALIAKAAGQDWFKDRLDLYGRSEDKRYLAGVDSADCNMRMKQTVKTATVYLENGEDIGLVEFISKHAAFFLSEVPADYTLLDKNQQFVRFNNRGRQLEKHEILKVRLIDKLDAVNSASPKMTQADAFAIWDSMTELISGVSMGNQEKRTLGDILLTKDFECKDFNAAENYYRAIVGTEEFLLIALARTEGVDKAKVSHDRSRLLETFKLIENDGDGAGRVEAFLKVLKDQVLYLKKFLIFIGNADEKYVIGRFKDDIEAESASGWLSDREDEVVAVQSFLNVSTTPHKWLIHVFDWLKRNSNNMTANAFIAELERVDREECERPCLPSWEDVDQGKTMAYRNINHYWFYRLDYELLKLWRERPGREDPWARVRGENDDGLRCLLNSFRFRRCGSVEHIVPQHQMEMQGEADHSFHNLALISGSRNSKFSNEVTEGKKQIIVQSRYTESLKMLHFLWGGLAPKEHGTTMYSILANTVNPKQAEQQS